MEVGRHGKLGENVDDRVAMVFNIVIVLAKIQYQSFSEITALEVLTVNRSVIITHAQVSSIIFVISSKFSSRKHCSN